MSKKKVSSLNLTAQQSPFCLKNLLVKSLFHKKLIELDKNETTQPFSCLIVKLLTIIVNTFIVLLLLALLAIKISLKRFASILTKITKLSDSLILDLFHYCWSDYSLVFEMMLIVYLDFSSMIIKMMVNHFKNML